ncbi:MAG: hypothetical protein ACR2IS_19970 [Nitrososphaeraceae archaeon]
MAKIIEIDTDDGNILVESSDMAYRPATSERASVWLIGYLTNITYITIA